MAYGIWIKAFIFQYLSTQWAAHVLEIPLVCELACIKMQLLARLILIFDFFLLPIFLICW